ncbi:unnamed protein product [Mytilus coruscus]|uniref:Uncharacterized protein n=1 Tax=Mytilus coruscus TaxID=42192 RepID=A0A6J8CI50_MYTCO|nr:unnamed protein product [Mytilus coruscus]
MSASSFLLNCVSKLFFKDGDPELATTYMKSLNITRIPIMKLRGNRFNYLFYNAAGTFYLHKHLITNLKSSKSSLNFIQDYIVRALSNDKILCILRALALLCKIFTEPYWKKAGDEVKTALRMGSIYNRVVEFLTICIDDPQLIIENDIKFFIGPDSRDDGIFSSL